MVYPIKKPFLDLKISHKNCEKWVVGSKSLWRPHEAYRSRQWFLDCQENRILYFKLFLIQFEKKGPQIFVPAWLEIKLRLSCGQKEDRLGRVNKVHKAKEI